MVIIPNKSLIRHLHKNTFMTIPSESACPSCITTRKSLVTTQRIWIRWLFFAGFTWTPCRDINGLTATRQILSTQDCDKVLPAVWKYVSPAIARAHSRLSDLNSAAVKVDWHLRRVMGLHKDGSISSDEEHITGCMWYLGLLSHVQWSWKSVRTKNGDRLNGMQYKHKWMQRRDESVCSWVREVRQE